MKSLGRRHPSIDLARDAWGQGDKNMIMQIIALIYLAALAMIDAAKREILRVTGQGAL